jgi:dipeptidyl aminopeptidase/acylaminoacyl peptidase
MPFLCAFAIAVLLAAVTTHAPAQTPYSGHGAESLSPETIRKYAPPPLDPSVSRRIQTMLDVRAPGLGQVTPDGKRLFFVWNTTGTPTLWRLDAPKGFPVQMTGGEDRTGLADITPDGKLLVLSRDHGGEEDPGLYLQPVEGGPTRVIQHKKGSRAFYGFVQDDARTIWFRANDVKPDSYAIHRGDLVTGKSEIVFSEPGLWDIADHRDEAGELTLLLQKATGSVSAEYFEWSAKTRALRPLFGQGEHVEYQAAYAAEPGEVLVLTNKLGEWRRLYRFREGNFTPVTPELGMDVASFVVDGARKRVYYTVNEGGSSRLRVLDARTLQPVRFPEMKGADQVILGSPSRDGRFVTVGMESARSPRAGYVYDWQTETLTQWVLPGAPEVDLARFAVARLEYYPARDGTKIPMWVRYPPRCAPEAPATGDPCPVVVLFHGGPEGQATPGFSPNAQVFVDAGFIHVQPNVRGSDGYGKTWLDADNGEKRLAVITDIDDAGRYWREKAARGGKTPKIGIMGGSYGGYATLIGMTMFAGTFDAGAAGVPIANFETFLRNTAPYRRALRISEYGDPDQDAEALRKLSPVTYLDQVKGPLLLIQGVDDPRVPAGESIQIHDLLEKRGVPSELILLEGEGHGAARRGSQAVQYGHMLRFLEEHLMGQKAPAGD